MIIPPVPCTVESWELLVVHPWYGDRSLQLTSSHPGRSQREDDNGAPGKCEVEDVAFKTSRNLGEIREVKLLGIFE